MNLKDKAIEIIEILKTTYPEADCTLNYKNPFELLVATQLAAQCTDARVNLVTPSLFKKFPDIDAFADADIKDLEEAVKSTGFYHNKAKNLKNCAQKLRESFNYQVPDTMEQLLTLPGTGRKTANLILGDVFGKPAIVVDTHAGRICRRLGLTKNTDPAKVEQDLLKIIPPDEGSDFCHRLVMHGREVCTARKPWCEKCALSDICSKII